MYHMLLNPKKITNIPHTEPDACFSEYPLHSSVCWQHQPI